MSDSTEITNELDNYGVWIKRPPQDAQEENIEDSIPENKSELNDIMPLETESEVSIDDFDIPAFDENEAEISTADEEISLDDFMDGDFTDPNPQSPSLSSNDSSEISLDDFLDDDFSSENSKQDEIDNDEPLDIDISFSDEANEIPTEEIIEEIDSSSIDENEQFSSQSPTSNEAKDVSSDFEAETEEISLDDFGIDDSCDDATAVAAGNSINASAEESVDLSDFGIDSDAEETPVTSNVKESAKNKVVDYNLSITGEDIPETKNEEMKKEDNLENNENTDLNQNESDKKASNVTSIENSLLQQIINDLSGLKNEIQSLKSDFEELKSKETIDIHNDNRETDVIENTEEPHGFFGNDDDDDTIALSGDELTNIMNTADFSEETIETEKSDEKEDNDFSEIDSTDIPETEEFGEPTLSEENIESVFETEDSIIPKNIEETPDETSSIEETCVEADDFSLNENSSDEIQSNNFESIIDDEIIEENVSDNTTETADSSFEESTEENTENFETIDEISSDEILNESIEEETQTSESEEPVDDYSFTNADLENDFETENQDKETVQESSMESTDSIDEIISDDEDFNDEPDSGLSIDFDNETLEEPNLDDLEESISMPEEISIPKVDSIPEENIQEDILVESSSTDFINSVQDSTDSIDSQEDTNNYDDSIDLEENQIDSEDSLSFSEESLTPEELTNVMIDVDENIEENEPTEENVQSFDDTINAADSIEESSLSDQAEINSIDEMLIPDDKSENEIPDENVNYLMEDSTPIIEDEKSMEQASTIVEEPAVNTYPEESSDGDLPSDLKADVKSVLLYMDQLLENLPEDKIVEFAKSEQFTTYKKLFNELGLS